MLWESVERVLMNCVIHCKFHKSGEYLDKLSNHWHLRKYCVPDLFSVMVSSVLFFSEVNFFKLNTAFNILNPTSHYMYHQFKHSTTTCPDHTVFMCFVFIWKQTVTCATCSINWFVFITEMKSVYSAVWTGSLNKAYWSHDAPTV